MNYSIFLIFMLINTTGLLPVNNSTGWFYVDENISYDNDIVHQEIIQFRQGYSSLSGFADPTLSYAVIDGNKKEFAPSTWLA